MYTGAPEHFEFWRGKTSKGHICPRSSARERSDRAGGGCGGGGGGGWYPPPTVGTFIKN